MKIGINCRSIINPGYLSAADSIEESAGIGHYTYYLVTELLRRDDHNYYFLYFDKSVRKEAIAALTAANPRVVARVFPFHAYKHSLKKHYSETLFLAAAARDGLDVFHQPDPRHEEIIPGRTVVTVHDMALFRYPKWFGKEARPRAARQAKVTLAASEIIAPTEFIKKELIHFLPATAEKINVIPHGVDVGAHHLWTEDVLSPSDHLERAEVKGMFKLRDHYILTVGTLVPRKNIESLVEAFRMFWKRNRRVLRETDLVIAGAKGRESLRILRAICKANRETEGRVKYVGYVSHQAKFGLMEHADAFVFPSLYEGFGFPPIEAAIFCCPVIAGSAEAIKEVMNGAAVYVDSKKPKEIAQALESVLKDADMRKKLLIAGEKLAARYQWKKTAEKTLALYQKFR